MMKVIQSLVTLLVMLMQSQSVLAFTSTPALKQIISVGGTSSVLFAGPATADPATREKTDRRTKKDNDGIIDDFGEDDREYPDLEYLYYESEERGEMDDPFHILLMGSTFDKPKISVSYVAGSLQYVLDMPFDEATELSQFAHDEGMSCLGTWSREECLSLGRQLQVRDIVCRVVPYCEGGQRGWQAKDAGSYSNSNSNNDNGFF